MQRSQPDTAGEKVTISNEYSARGWLVQRHQSCGGIDMVPTLCERDSFGILSDGH